MPNFPGTGTERGAVGEYSNVINVPLPSRAGELVTPPPHLAYPLAIPFAILAIPLAILVWPCHSGMAIRPYTIAAVLTLYG